MDKPDLVKPIQSYKKITSNLLYLGQSHILKFIVEFYTKDKNKNSKYYLSEYNYNNNLYLYMDLKYYLLIENRLKDDISGEKESFRIDNSNIYQFMVAIENASKWFVDRSNVNMFAKMQDGTIKVISEIDPIIVRHMYGNILSISPAAWNDASINDIGVLLDINDNNSNIFINASGFMNMKYFLDHFNMYQSALQFATYVGRPDLSIQMQESNVSKNNVGFLSRVRAIKND